MFSDNELSIDTLPNRLVLKQPINGFRSGSDALLLVDYFLSKHNGTQKNNHILDIGCGSGAIALSVLKTNPHTHVTGLELQENYCHLAIDNAKLNHLSDRFNIINGDLEVIHTLLPPDSFDYIITNPPFYHSGNGRMSADIGKQIAHHGTMNFIQWIRKSLYALKNSGFLMMICRTERLADVYAALDKRAGNIHIQPIIAPNATHAKRIIISCQKAAKGGTVIALG
jgi:tRNA1Val (adenine37-N6)-methyltransferase